MDAVLLAGGIPRPEEPLYSYSHGEAKALIDVAGKPMIQWVLDALGGSQCVNRVFISGLGPSAGLACSRPVDYVPDQGGLLENIRSGVFRALELNPDSGNVLVVSSDIPGITPEMVNWVAETAQQNQHDMYYNVIRREVMEARYPASKRSYVHLKDMEVCGGDMNVIRAQTVATHKEIWERLVASRKNALKQASLLGYDTLLLLMLRLLDLQGAVNLASKRLGIQGRAMVCPYAEIGMDVDKPHQLEIMRADLAQHVAA